MSVGTPLPHDSAPLHVAGSARYVDDMPLPANALHLAFGLSTVAHGEITGMDLSAVRASPGVVAVWTAADLPFANDVSPSAHDEPLLATGTVHYVGQPVFLVVAENHLAARKAARKGKISYRDLPALHRLLGSNIAQMPVAPLWERPRRQAAPHISQAPPSVQAQAARSRDERRADRRDKTEAHR